MIIAKVAFYDDVCRFDVQNILRTEKVVWDEDIPFGSLNQSLIMLSSRLDIPFEILERSIERIQWL